MTLRWREAEKRVRGRVRQELRASDEARRMARRLRSAARRDISGAVFVRVLFPAVLCVPLAGGQVGVCLALVTLYATGSAFLRAAELVNRLLASEDLSILAHMPLPDEAFFDLQWNRFLRSSLWSAWWVTLPLLIVTVASKNPSALPGAVAIGFLHWCAIVSIAAVLAARRPLWNLGRTGVLFVFLGVLLFFFRNSAAPILDGPGRWALLALPAAWLSLAFQEGLIGGQAWACFLLLPVVPLLLLLRASRRSIRDGFRLREVAFPSSPDAEPLTEKFVDNMMAVRAEHDALLVEHPELKALEREKLEEALPRAIAGWIQTREFMELPTWADRGWLDRMVERWLTPRQRVVADFMLSGGTSWTSQWNAALVLSIVAAGLSLVVPGSLASIPILVFAIGWLVGAPIMGGAWRGFEGHGDGTRRTPMYAVYPLDHGEVLAVVLKANLVRLMAWAPLLAASAVVLAGRYGRLPLEGALIGAKVALLVMAIQPVLGILKFSWENGAGGHLRLSLTSVIAGVVGVILVGGLATCAILTFLPRPGLAVGGVLGFALVAWIAMLALRAWHLRRADLVGPPTGPLAVLPIESVQQARRRR